MLIDYDKSKSHHDEAILDGRTSLFLFRDEVESSGASSAPRCLFPHGELRQCLDKFRRSGFLRCTDPQELHPVLSGAPALRFSLRGCVDNRGSLPVRRGTTRIDLAAMVEFKAHRNVLRKPSLLSDRHGKSR